MNLKPSFGGGETTVYFDTNIATYVDYETHPEFHQKYGGKRLYTSRSGKSGHGVCPAGDQVACRTFRSDVGGEKLIRFSKGGIFPRTEIFVATQSHAGLAPDWAVTTVTAREGEDGVEFEVAFLSHYDSPARFEKEKSRCVALPILSKMAENVGFLATVVKKLAPK